jgi:hypothetical protein
MEKERERKEEDENNDLLRQSGMDCGSVGE